MSLRYCEIWEFEELDKVVELEKIVWDADTSGVLPVDLLWASICNGGALLGAYLDDLLVGACFGFPAKRGSDYYFWSYGAGVRSDFQGRGVGTKLKLMQKEWCLSNDYTKIKWTFDPLQRGNANFNMKVLGATAQTYRVNYYGYMEDAINAGLPSDRLEVVWNLTSAPDAQHSSAIDRHEFREAALLTGENNLPQHHEFLQDAKRIFIEIPSDLAQLKSESADIALEWRLATRKAFQTAFSHHFTVTDFVKVNERYLYILTAPQNWFLYVAECSDNSLYTGITNNLQRRIKQHNRGKGAAYTATRRPITLLAAWKFPDRSSAQRAESAFKKQKRVTKLNHIHEKKPYREGTFLSKI